MQAFLSSTDILRIIFLLGEYLMKYRRNCHRYDIRSMISFVFKVNKYLDKSDTGNHKGHVIKYVQGASNWTKSFNYSCISFQGILRIKLISCSQNSLARKLLNSFDGSSTFFGTILLASQQFLLKSQWLPPSSKSPWNFSLRTFSFCAYLRLSFSELTSLSYVQGGNIWRCVTQIFYDFLN